MDRLPSWVLWLIGVLGSIVGGLLLLLVTVVIQETRDAKGERNDLRDMVRQHVLSPHVPMEAVPRRPPHSDNP